MSTGSRGGGLGNTLGRYPIKLTKTNENGNVHSVTKGIEEMANYKDTGELILILCSVLIHIFIVNKGA